jgi:BirA family transcriptional regulator, biotin operon repressor / biotin---[acetyl-CoA-carboxylase] ligase
MNSFKPKILRYESLPSTNNEVARLAAQGVAEGLAVVADEQTAGRGRMQRTWVSPKGAGLYFSILLRPEISMNRWPLVTLMAALAVAEGLQESCSLVADIKWPNDLLAGERKICGILAEVIDTESGKAIVLGIGINLTNQAFPEDLAGRAISVAEATGRRPDREPILKAILQALTRWYLLLHEEEGSERMLAAWASRSSYADGKLVRVLNGDETVIGLTRGLEPDGALRLETDNGTITIVRAGDVINVRPAGSAGVSPA